MADEYIKKSDAEEYLSQPITMSWCLSVEECKTRRRQQKVDLLLLRTIPAADVATVRHGRWVSVPHKKARICSLCEQDEPYKFADEDANVFDYCPHCGAKMDGE